MSMMDNIININFYILSHILIVLGIGTLYREAEDTKQALAKLNRSLEEEVAKQVRKLNEQNLIMAQQARLASMGEMLGMIAHQWRQPLNTINSNIAVIQKLISESPSKDPLLEKKLDNITNHTAFMSDTIEDFSGFFHPNKQAISFNPCETLRRAVKLLGNEVEKIDMTISCSETAVLYTYENEYLQVVLSILHNAIENFAVNKISRPSLHLSIYTDDTYVILSIQDNGGGIRTKRLESIFDPYFTTNHTKKNSGLGLYMAKLLIEESMHGNVTVENKKEGACFKISLPKGEKNEP
jgi:signal transduction histidine kinase